MSDVEAERLDLAQGRGRGWCFCGESFDGMVDIAPSVRHRVHQHVEHDGRAAKMCTRLSAIASTMVRAVMSRQHTSVPPMTGIIRVWFHPMQ